MRRTRTRIRMKMKRNWALETCAWNFSIREMETDGFIGFPGTFNELGTHTLAKLFFLGTCVKITILLCALGTSSANRQ